MTVHEDHWRWRLDDGGEGSGGATWHELEDVAHSFASAGLDINVRLRFSLHSETATTVTLAPQLQYNRNGGGWNDVDAASSVARSSASTEFADGDNTTEHGVTFVGSGTFFGPPDNDNFCMDDNNGSAGGADNDVPAQDFQAVEYCFQIREADVADSDSILFRMVRSDASVFDSYPGTDATATISLPAAVGDPWLPAYVRRQQLIPSVTR